MPEQRYVYFAYMDERRFVKIGITGDLKRRMKQLRAHLIFAIECEHDFAPKLEKALHEQFHRHRSPSSEWFYMADELATLIATVIRLGYWPWSRRHSVVRMEA